MAKPRIPESERGFIPPFCPNSECRYHYGDAEGWRFQRRGFRRVVRNPRVIRRFHCSHCKRNFSSSTFREDYWKKIPGITAAVYQRVADGQSMRGIARGLSVSLTTVRRRTRSLAQQSLLRTERHMSHLAGKLRSAVVLDGFRTFAGSQFEVAELNTAVCSDSGYLLTIDPIALRRPGRMTKAQKSIRKAKEERSGRPDPRERTKVTIDVLNTLKRLSGGLTLELRSDEEPAYERAVRRVGGFVHVTVSSKRRRDTSNPLWRVNHLHRMFRHFAKNVARETIAHSKHFAGLCDRIQILQLWLNVSKGISERRVDLSRLTPAMLMGFESRSRKGHRLFADRLFPNRERLQRKLRPRYFGTIRARRDENVRPYIHKFAA